MLVWNRITNYLLYSLLTWLYLLEFILYLLDSFINYHSSLLFSSTITHLLLVSLGRKLKSIRQLVSGWLTWRHTSTFGTGKLCFCESWLMTPLYFSLFFRSWISLEADTTGWNAWDMRYSFTWVVQPVSYGRIFFQFNCSALNMVTFSPSRSASVV